jgi:hypothetical protein
MEQVDGARVCPQAPVLYPFVAVQEGLGNEHTVVERLADILTWLKTRE